jgi:hypothetical protein
MAKQIIAAKSGIQNFFLYFLTIKTTNNKTIGSQNHFDEIKNITWSSHDTFSPLKNSNNKWSIFSRKSFTR